MNIFWLGVDIDMAAISPHDVGLDFDSGTGFGGKGDFGAHDTAAAFISDITVIRGALGQIVRRAVFHAAGLDRWAAKADGQPGY